jgi:beta-phosphoglucomutase-like phosphatase (HAD superfamily)
MRKIDTILFDVDEVVVASSYLQCQAEQDVARSMAAELALELDVDGLDWSRFRGFGRVAIASELFGVPKTDALADHYRLKVVDRTVAIATPDNVTFVDGAEEALDELLGSRVIQAGAVTSSHRDIYEMYNRILNLGRYFNTSVAHGEAWENKPHPAPYQLGMRLLDATPERTAVIEDSKSGIESGLAAGALVTALASAMSTVEDLRSTTKADLVASDWPDIVTQLNPLLVTSRTA